MEKQKTCFNFLSQIFYLDFKVKNNLDLSIKSKYKYFDDEIKVFNKIILFINRVTSSSMQHTAINDRNKKRIYKIITTIVSIFC